MARAIFAQVSVVRPEHLPAAALTEELELFGTRGGQRCRSARRWKPAPSIAVVSGVGLDPDPNLLTGSELTPGHRLLRGHDARDSRRVSGVLVDGE